MAVPILLGTDYREQLMSLIRNVSGALLAVVPKSTE
jgi:hypothetical protein